MLVSDSKRTFSTGDFPVVRFGSLLAPGVRWRPLPVSSPAYDESVYIEISGRDRTAFVEWQSLEIENVLTRQADTARFSFKKTSASALDIDVGDDVRAYDTGTLVFRGVVLRVDREQLGADLLRIRVEAIDYTYELDGKAVAEEYADQTANAIINDIVLRYAPQFTTNGVNAPQTIAYVNFARQTLSSCLEELADALGYDWYVDENKDIHFGPSQTDSSPVEIADENGTYLVGTLNFKDDISQIRNVIFVRGGEEIGSSQTYSKVADGTQLLFSPGYHFSEKPTVTVAAASKTIGIEGQDDPAGFDCLWNSNRDYILFKTATKPANGQQVDITGTPLNAILLKLPHQTSVAEFGERHLSITDKTIITRDGARQRAMAELLRYAETLRSGSFDTLTKGIRAGQTLAIDSDLFEIAGEYIVTQVRTSLRTPTSYQYEVTFVSTKLMDIVDLFVKILRSKVKEQAYSRNESFDPAEFAPETALVSESVSAATAGNSQTEATASADGASLPGGTGIDFGTIFVFGPWTPSTSKRQFNFDRSYFG